jgi:hypothetical protein
LKLEILQGNVCWWATHNILDIKLIFLKLWIFTDLNTVFPVIVFVFDFEGFSEGVLHGHSIIVFHFFNNKFKEEIS